MSFEERVTLKIDEPPEFISGFISDESLVLFLDLFGDLELLSKEEPYGIL
jgi:hypothetical protein